MHQCEHMKKECTVTSFNVYKMAALSKPEESASSKSNFQFCIFYWNLIFIYVILHCCRKKIKSVAYVTTYNITFQLNVTDGHVCALNYRFLMLPSWILFFTLKSQCFCIVATSFFPHFHPPISIKLMIFIMSSFLCFFVSYMIETAQFPIMFMCFCI